MRNLTEAQQTCGDVIDRLPCLRCGATSLKDCTLALSERVVASRYINDTPGIYNRLLAKRGRMEAALANRGEAGALAKEQGE